MQGTSKEAAKSETKTKSFHPVNGIESYCVRGDCQAASFGVELCDALGVVDCRKRGREPRSP